MGCWAALSIHFLCSPQVLSQICNIFLFLFILPWFVMHYQVMQSAGCCDGEILVHFSWIPLFHIRSFLSFCMCHGSVSVMCCLLFRTLETLQESLSEATNQSQRIQELLDRANEDHKTELSSLNTQHEKTITQLKSDLEELVGIHFLTLRNCQY